MSAYRKGLILGINLLVLGCLLKVMLFDDTSDVVGLFVLSGLLFLVVFDIYALAIAKLFFKESTKFYIELLFSILLLIPFLLLWRLTS